MFGKIVNQNPDAETMSVMNVFSECEKVSVINEKMDKDKFLACFNTQRTIVTRKYPHAFDFMDDGFDFLIFMLGVIFLYFWVVSPKINAILGGAGKEEFDFGTWVKNFGKTVYEAPNKVYNAVKDKLK